MKLSLPLADLHAMTLAQLNTFFPDGGDLSVLSPQILQTALDRLDYCFSHVALPAYCQDGQASFNHLHADQHAMFLWFLSSAFFQKIGKHPVADKLFGLNKALHGLQCMYDTALPKIFLLLHTTGTVLGKATYGELFVSYQRVTVGLHAGHYPVLGQGVALAANASVFGDCHIGDRVSIGSATMIFRMNLPPDSTAYRDQEGKLIVRQGGVPFAQRFFNVDLIKSIS